MSDVIIKLNEYELTRNMGLVEAPDWGLLLDSDTDDWVFRFIMHTNDYAKERDILVHELNRQEIHHLYISIYPDRYWPVRLNTEHLSYARDEERQSVVHVQMNFERVKTHNGKRVAYGIKEKTQEFPAADLIKLKNDGTYRYYPIIETTMKSDNGLFALTSPHGTYQLGDPSEVDEETKQEFIQAFHDNLEDASLWTTGNPSLINPSYYFSGKFFKTRKPRVGFGANYGDTTGKHAGPSLMRNFKMTNTNYRAEADLIVKVDNPNQQGGIFFGLMSKGKVIAYIAINKTGNGVYTTPTFGINGKHETVTGSTTSYFVDFYGTLGIEKVGETYTFKFKNRVNNKTYTVSRHVPREHVDTLIDGVIVFSRKFDKHPAFTINHFYDVRISSYEDVHYNFDNTMSTGDVIQIDMRDGTAKRNGLPMLGAIKPGSKGLYVEPGEAEWFVSVSDFATKPDVKVTYREVFL
ncbi:phage tail domain-containing protein [Atopobacter phocae]|uniref:phage tail domain-containing protein n=1 Tax=Atopobacter phocae TaxID=136492 RepID=UPI0004B0F115|nr:phage tail domain-containing protein [Atopobacter phocae]